jgi:hypothetical protein
MAYFFPGGGGGTFKLAVATNSSKSFGKRRWPTIQPRNRRDNSAKSAAPFASVTGLRPATEGVVAGAGVFEFAAAWELSAVVAAAWFCGEVSECFPHPAASRAIPPTDSQRTIFTFIMLLAHKRIFSANPRAYTGATDDCWNLMCYGHYTKRLTAFQHVIKIEDTCFANLFGPGDVVKTHDNPASWRHVICLRRGRQKDKPCQRLTDHEIFSQRKCRWTNAAPLGLHLPGWTVSVPCCRHP